MDIVDFTGLWSCTSGPAVVPAPGGGGGMAFVPDEDAWHKELARRWRREQLIAEDDEDVVRMMQ